ADRPAGPVRERHRASDDLVGLARIDPEAERHLDGLVELGLGQAFDEADRLGRRVFAGLVDQLAGGLVALAVAAHASTSTPMLRAVPAMIFMAWSTSLALRSAFLRSAICRTWSPDRRATFVRFGSLEPFSTPAACLISSA